MFKDVQERVFNRVKPADLAAVPSVEDGALGRLTCICADVESGECWGPPYGVYGETQLPERFEAAPPLVLVDAPSQAALWSACERAVGGFDI